MVPTGQRSLRPTARGPAPRGQGSPHGPATGHQDSAQALVHPPPSTPPLCLQMAEQLMTLAYDNGINLFDTAEVYAAGK